MNRIVMIAGTRPEVIKLAPVYLRAVERFGADAVEWVSTGQHTALADLALKAFRIVPGTMLDTMAPDGSLATLTSNLITKLDQMFSASRPAAVVVQGDTTTAFAGALTAFYHRIPSVHVEAGLRSFDNDNPFPEEANRRMVAALASLHCAPTPGAADNLRREGVPEGQILTTGNTVVDAVNHVREHVLKNTGSGSDSGSDSGSKKPRRILVTMHRREAWGDEMEKMCAALRDIADHSPDVEINFPVHLNPRVREPIYRLLGRHKQIRLLDPLDYLGLQTMLSQSYLVLTDSGGIQEEAPSYGVPVLVLRRLTERPEAVEQGFAEVTGTDPDAIVKAARRLLDDATAYQAMVARTNPFGDGHAGQRIAEGLEKLLFDHRLGSEQVAPIATTAFQECRHVVGR